MKRLFNILLFFSAAFTFSSCSKDFLDAKPSENLSPEQIAEAAKKDPTVIDGFVNGLYSTMYAVGTGGTTGHDDFGQKGNDIYLDMLSGDMVLGGLNYGWYSGVARLQSTVDYTSLPSYVPWRYYYRLIFAANTVVDALSGDPNLSNASRWSLGQAKAMRAYAYFYLTQLYVTKYGDGSQLAVPVYTTATGTANKPRSTTKEVYDLIIADLRESITALADFNRAGQKQKVNKYVAEGLLAYALGARGSTADYQEIITLTDDIINNGGFTMLPKASVTTSGFNNVSSPDWIWGADLTLDAGLDLISWWGQVDIFTYSYASAGDPKIINQNLYESIRPGDTRKAQFDPSNEVAPYAPVNKFFDPAREIDGQRNVVTDYVYMRLEEMVLLNAEAKAKTGQDGPARDALKSLLALRMDDYSFVDALSGTALQNEIYYQTRVELWGEGKSYLAMKRNKATIKRGDNDLVLEGQSFSYDDPKLTFVIPQAEVLNNPFLEQ